MSGRWLSTAFLLVAGAAACRADPPRATSAAGGTGWFVEGAAASGLDFVHRNGMSGRLSLPEIMGAGAGFFDYDNDGDLDAYLVQGGALPGSSQAGVPMGGDRLYRNDLRLGADGTRTLTFTDVTSASGIDVRSYGMGVAAADIDNDGWTDLYLTRLGPDVLLRNNGDGTFSDITAQSGLADSDWSVSASFLDIDRDGLLDLFVGNYVRFDAAAHAECRGASGIVDYCTPQAYAALAGRLFRNNGRGRFTDVTAAAGVAAEYGPALGTIAADFNGDGWDDFYVANDGAANQLWMNRRNGTFENTALLAGAALNANGRPEGSMGVDAGDFDNDGDEDLVVTNLFGEGTVLYVNDGTGAFEDRGAAAGTRTASLKLTGFGVTWADLDNDGWLDVLSANGAVQRAQPFAVAGEPFPLAQPMQLLRHGGDGRFEDLTTTAGAALSAMAVGRGAAFGDVDNDGDVDVLVSTNNGRARLLINQVGNRQHWLGVRLVAASGRDALGARLGVPGPDGRIRWRRARSDGSYASANDPRVLVGLGRSTTSLPVRVRWPDGRTEERVLEGIDRWHVVRQDR